MSLRRWPDKYAIGYTFYSEDRSFCFQLLQSMGMATLINFTTYDSVV